ncbi:hypothetical protein RHMOL_Rhmol06G0275900 [Rhododendron molle]|uniref:Uncharacterized protein n=1 Tax=Rhododendron molle TaxID=49168 RepID=A0ACC0NHP9_RHOML|nr:hypothetical protein RHMOL_Rhmol06G0275900 [Rhododendron molle]
MRQFMSNSKFLHEMDAAMGEPGVRSPIVGIRVEDEGHSPQFCGNFEPQNDEQWEGEDEDQIQQKGEEEDDGDQIKETGDDIEQEVEEEVAKDSLEGEEVEVAKDSLDEEEDGDHIKETGDDSEQEGEVGGTSTFIHGSGSSKRKQEEVVILTDPIKTKRRRNVKPSPSIKSPYVAVPFVKTTKITTEEETIIKYLMNGPTNDLSEVLIRIKGAKWPLTRKEVAESFRVRGHVSNMSNLLASESDEFSTVLRDDCDPDKVGYELLKCDMLFLPVLESQHWFCVCISPVASRAFILDSMKPTAENKKHRLEQANIIVFLFSHSFGPFSHVFQFCFCSHDCGIYVMKFVDRWDGRIYPSSELQGPLIPNIRKRLLLHLFTDDNNKERESILKAIPRR